MNILHISTSTLGGAALATLRLHQGLMNSGVDSKVLSLGPKQESFSNVVVVKKQFETIQKIYKSLRYRLNIGLGSVLRMHDNSRRSYQCVYTYPLSDYCVEKHPLVKNWADIIHLHWCDDFINYPSFFRKVTKPIVWTFHDISIGFGGFHFQIDYDKGIYYYKQIESHLLDIKKKSLSKNTNVTLVALSNEMQGYIKKIDYLKNKDVHVLPNVIDTDSFVPCDKMQSRDELQLSQEKKILLFVSEFVETPSKGLDDLRCILNEMQSNNILLCIVGNYDSEKIKQDTIHTKYWGKVTDVNTLKKIYSAADYLVVPSRQECFPQTPFEAMSCGTPVIAFPCGSLPDYINDINGLICESYSTDELKSKIELALTLKFDSKKIRDWVIENLSPTAITDLYINLYQNILKK